MNEKTIQIEMDRADYVSARQRAIAEKDAYQSQLSEINSKCAVILPTAQYKKLQSDRAVIIKKMFDKQSEIRTITERLKEIEIVLEANKKIEALDKLIVKQLVAIRDKWHDFSMEDANHPMARRTAYSISQEIKEALKPIFEKEKESE